MDRNDWDDRYRGETLVWKADPNQFLVGEVADLSPGRALDVACGEGRNAVWLATQGWDATGVDFSAVALAKGARLASDRGVEVTWVEADLQDWSPPAGAFDLVAVFYLQVPAAERRRIYRRMADAVAPGGTMLVVGHHTRNLTEGYGGPQNPQMLFSAEDVAADLGSLSVVKAELVQRTVDTPEGERRALDALVRAVRP
ncbi:MAG: class I SAM-dependent methyltransferase [Acidobacteriota bacterium]|nr:class I SAM-dependent methyltransferase [Acidobacteriota bacterium]